jgi:2EXR family
MAVQKGIWSLPQQVDDGGIYTGMIIKPKDSQHNCQLKQTKLPPPLTTFTCFGRLPAELRVLIWELARHGPRVVRLAWSKDPPKAPSWSRFPELYRANYSSAPIPAMLHACSESRQVALKWYQLLFGVRAAPARVYFDPETDYIRVGCEKCLGCRCRECCEMCYYTKLACVRRILFPCADEATPFFEIYLFFRQVKEVLLFDTRSGLFKEDLG